MANDQQTEKYVDFSAFREQINAENRRAFRLLAKAGIPLGIINFFSQLVMTGSSGRLVHELLIVACALTLLWIDHWLLPEDYPHSTAALYAAQTPFLILSVLLGTVWDPTHQATTILLMLIVMPVFLMDRPTRVIFWMGLWSVTFLLACRAAKPQEIFEIDAVHLLEFFVASMVVTNLVIHVHMSFLKNLGEARYLLRHDRQTGCLSRYALEEQSGSLLRRPLVLLLAELDQLRLYRDFYGHSAADAMMLFFTGTMTETFGENAVFRYGGDEILCVMTDGAEEDCLRRLESCRAALNAFAYEGRQIPLSCGVGYVTGSAGDAEELRGMIRLANINGSKAKHQGHGRTVGSAFNQESLRQGVIDANLYTHAKAYEINQLTGLPDLSYFIARSDEMLGSVANYAREPVLGYLKLMRLRDINNEFGYASGDELIADTSRLLRRAFSERHVCYVTAGEFCVLCYRDEAEKGAEIMRRELEAYKPGMPVSCKMGFAFWRQGQRTISLVDEAKLALNSISRTEDYLRFYDSVLDGEIHFRQYIVSHVDEAVEKGWLQVYYQPIARAVTGQVCNEEALSRWNDPQYGFLMPYRFIPVLEESGLMYKVNLHVVRQALRHTRHRQELGVPVVPVSVNLSRRDFERCDMVSEISALVEKEGFTPEMLKIEITESAFISNPERLRHEVDRFHERGFEVWLDDFGSEYSTLNLLQELDFDLVKLDMKFMRNFTTGGKNHIIVSKVIEMAKQLGMDTLIEGVETLEHFEMMQKLGCDKIQGYLFNRPNSIDYIINRALTGTGLSFEPEDATPYYQAIGSLDLSEPLQVGWDGSFRVSKEIPSGVIEQRDGSFYCLRGNESFLNHLGALGVLEDRAEGFALSVRIHPVPAPLEQASARCVSEDQWVSFDAVGPEGEAVTVYLRRVTDYSYRGAKAMLAALLPGRTDRREPTRVKTTIANDMEG